MPISLNGMLILHSCASFLSIQVIRHGMPVGAIKTVMCVKFDAFLKQQAKDTLKKPSKNIYVSQFYLG
jgi:hypothetical protein